MKMKSFLMIALIATATLFVACGKKDAKAKEAAKTEAAQAANLAADVQAYIDACQKLDADAVIATYKKVLAYPEDVLNNAPEELDQAAVNAMNYFMEHAEQEDREKVEAAFQ